MLLQTKITIPEPPYKISYTTPCLLMGSCFSDYIGSIMEGYKFPLLMNPFGTLFNPASIAANLENLIEGKQYREEDLNFHEGLWFSFDHYTLFSGPERDSCLNNINISTSHASGWLKNCEFLVLTFGSAWVYRHKPSGKIVANCHKIPGSFFSRELLQAETIVNLYDRLISRLAGYNPSIKIIFTLSPVRYWADGAVNNQLSKSILHYSIQQILKKTDRAFYFPAYEIFMDELRDYRFYAVDMLHPSKQGAEYVWERFLESWIDEPSKVILAKVDHVLKAVRHRPLNPRSEAHKKFRELTLQKIHELTKEYPFLDFKEELYT